jgi:hypothetical protein
MVCADPARPGPRTGRDSPDRRTLAVIEGWHIIVPARARPGAPGRRESTTAAAAQGWSPGERDHE